MDFCFPYDDSVQLSQNEYKKGEMIFDVSPKTSSPAFDVHVDTPRIPSYPSRFLQRGRYSRRRRRAGLSPFYRYTPRYSRQFHQRGYSDYYDVYQDYCPEQCACSSQKKRKSEMGYLPYPNICREDFEDYYVSDHPIKMSDWRMSSEYFNEQERDWKCASNSDLECGAVDSHVTPLKNSITFPNTRTKSKSKTSARKEKKQNNLEVVVEKSDCSNANVVTGTEVAINTNPQNIEWYLLTTGNAGEEVSLETLNVFENPAPENPALNQSESEVDSAVKNMQLDQTQSVPNSEQTFVLQEMQSTTPILSTLDEQGTLHFESEETANDYAFLDNLITELEQANNVEKNKIIEVATMDGFQDGNRQIVTYPESESNNSETNLKLNDNQFASLLQQNQILTDLLSKVITNSDIIKSNKDNEAKSEVDSVRTTLMNQDENAANRQQKGGDINLNKEQMSASKKSNLISNDTIINNLPMIGDTISNQSCQTGIESNQRYQPNKGEDTFNTSDFSNLDVMCNNEFAHFETSLSSITNYILDEPIMKCANAASELLEKTTENYLEFSDEISARGKDNVKTLVRKTTVRRRTSPKAKAAQKNRYCQTDEKLLKKGKHCTRPCCCKKNMRNVETQTMDFDEPQTEMNLKMELDNTGDSLKTRKLRSSTKGKQDCSKQNLEDSVAFSCNSPEFLLDTIIPQERDTPLPKATTSAPPKQKKPKRKARTRRRYFSKKKRDKRSTTSQIPVLSVTLD